MIRWFGRAAWDDEAWSFYALRFSGKGWIHPRIRLVSVTRSNGSHFYRIAMPWQKSPPPGRMVDLEFSGISKGDISV